MPRTASVSLRDQARTDDEKRQRIHLVMRLHREGAQSGYIRRRTGTRPTVARKWAAELGIPWTGKPF